jgi:protein disulfide-isomerase-like protein
MDVINLITDFIQENTLFVVFIFMFVYYVYSNNYYSKNFEKNKKDEDENVITLILFFAPWCPHCKEVKPIFEELQKEYSGDKKVKISIVNGDEDKESIKSNNVTSYPTIILKKNNVKDIYNGVRSKKNFENFIKDYKN